MSICYIIFVEYQNVMDRQADRFAVSTTCQCADVQ